MRPRPGRRGLDHLPSALVVPTKERPVPGAGSPKLAEARAAFEREFLIERLRANRLNISRTAEVVGLARESLSRKLKSLKIEVERLRDDA